jgi:aromatic-L-amino-acid/L-tryptophan decarboxylase
MKKLLNMNELQKQIKKSLESISRHYNKIDKLPIQPNVKPGFLYSKLSSELPENPSDFEEILKTIETDIFPNLVQWHHPKFFGYFPSTVSHTAITAEMLSSAVGTPNFNWNVSPASHELEWVVSDWMVKILGLPEKFLLDNEGAGGIVNSITEGSFLSVNIAKFKKIKELNLEPTDVRRLKFVAYYPETNKSWAQKVLQMKDIHFQRVLKVSYDENLQIYKTDPKELLDKIKEDIEAGLIPFWYGAQLGSTDCGVFDDLEIIGPIMKEYGIYLNVDAAYTGVFWFLPESRVKGLEYANNICLNMAKVGLAGVIGAMMFNDDKENLIRSSGNIDGIIYRGNHDTSKFDYKDFTVGFGRKISSLKIFMLLKSLGISGYQDYLRTIISRGKLFEDLIASHPRFELFCRPVYGLVCFRVKPSDDSFDLEVYNTINLKLYEKLKENSEDGFVSSSVINNIRFLRFVSGNPLTENDDIKSFFYKLLDVSNNI